MSSDIKVFLFPDTIKFFEEHKDVINKITNDTKCTIKIHNKKRDPFISIKGKFENTHKSRIIIQDIEKNNYRIAHINKIS